MRVKFEQVGTKLCYPLASADFLLGLLTDSEDGGDMFLRKSDCLQTTRHYNPENHYLFKNTLFDLTTLYFLIKLTNRVNSLVAGPED
jgi:hypothetical protein